MNRTRIGIALGLLYLIWGSTYLAIRYALEGGMPPLVISGVRYFSAGSMLFAWCLVRGERFPSLRQWLSCALVGCLLVSGNVCVVFAEQWVSSSVAAVALASSPLWISFFAGLFGTWPTRHEWVGLGIGLCGVVVLQTGSDLRASPAGAAILMLSCCCWGLGSTIGKKVSLPRGMISSGAQMLIGGTVVVIIGLIHGDQPWAVHAPARAWLSLAYLSIFGSLIGYSCFQYLLTHVRPALAATYAYVNPLVAVAIGSTFAGEIIRPRVLIALALILGGVGLISGLGSISSAMPFLRARRAAPPR